MVGLPIKVSPGCGGIGIDPLAVPLKVGLTIVGAVASTTEPVPVVATADPTPLVTVTTPVPLGRPLPPPAAGVFCSVTCALKASGASRHNNQANFFMPRSLIVVPICLQLL